MIALHNATTGKLLPLPQDLRNTLLALDCGEYKVAAIDCGGSGPKASAYQVDSQRGTLRKLGDTEFYTPETPPEDLITDLFSKFGPVAAVGYGVAARVENNRCGLSWNTRHPVDGDQLSQKFGPVRLLNDLAATTHGILVPPRGGSELRLIQRGVKSGGTGNIAIIAPGSGTGVGGRINGEVHSSEGSHIPLSAITKTQRQYISALERYGLKTTYDSVICGRGLANFFRFMWKKRGRRLPPEIRFLLDDSDLDPAATPRHILVSQMALNGNDEVSGVALQATQLYMEFLAMCCQTVTMLFTVERLYLGGGAMANMAAHPNFKTRLLPVFLKTFLTTPEACDQKWLRERPIHVLRYPHDVALKGAAQVAALAAGEERQSYRGD